jgi:hypothetical protein
MDNAYDKAYMIARIAERARQMSAYLTEVGIDEVILDEVNEEYGDYLGVNFLIITTDGDEVHGFIKGMEAGIVDILI